ncbi:MAG TPA: A/G-specific adenine glycosylase [Steroidobacteraceae bacterium]|nr:A/G-specific adenine glycosylase [Steroidobacteraceae bacterium]
MKFEPAEFTQRLLAWFDIHGRHDLPWQQNPTPYRVWISEVMLQQTQVLTVIPYYERFMMRFPDVEALAAAPLDAVLHEWTGLGYYARARNLRACAQALLAHHGGEFPEGIDLVTKLPGIGRSTAGAILALSRGERHPILDGNVRRVLARVFGIAGDPSSAAVITQLWAQSEACTPSLRVGAYTQAVMDLGATVCSRARPACTVCPMSSGCIAALEGRQAELPGAKQKRRRGSREATLLIAETGACGAVAVLVERRPMAGIWGGLWSPPQFESEFAALDWVRREIGEPESRSQPLAPIHHAFTHFDLLLNPIRVRCRVSAVREGDDRIWYRLGNPPQVGLPQPIRRLFERLALDDRA